MTLTVQLMESPCITWETMLPGRYDREYVSSPFTLRNSRLNFKLQCLEETEMWELSLKSMMSLGTILVVCYLKQYNGGLRRLRHNLVFTCSGLYKSVLSFGRSVLDGKGILMDEVTLVVVFHFDNEASSRDIIKDSGFAFVKDTKKLKLISFPEDLSNQSPCLQTLSENLEKLFDKKEYSDVILKCGDRTFHADRKILSARSEVFEAMFRNKMSESETGVVNIEDIKPDILEQFLRYVYTGRLDSLRIDAAFDLYGVGEKYCMRSLKRNCLTFMMDHLSEENICEVLSLADAFGDPELLNMAETFAVNVEGFLKSEEWNEFAKEHMSVAIKVYKKYVMK